MILSMLTSHNFTRKPTKRGGSHATKQSWRMQWDCRSNSVTQKRQLNAGRRTSGSSSHSLDDFHPQITARHPGASYRIFPPTKTSGCAPVVSPSPGWLRWLRLGGEISHRRRSIDPSMDARRQEGRSLRSGFRLRTSERHESTCGQSGSPRASVNLWSPWKGPPFEEGAKKRPLIFTRDQSNSAGETLRSHKRDRRYISRFVQKGPAVSIDQCPGRRCNMPSLFTESTTEIIDDWQSTPW